MATFTEVETRILAAMQDGRPRSPAQIAKESQVFPQHIGAYMARLCVKGAVLDTGRDPFDARVKRRWIATACGAIVTSEKASEPAKLLERTEKLHDDPVIKWLYHVILFLVWLERGQEMRINLEGRRFNVWYPGKSAAEQVRMYNSTLAQVDDVLSVLAADGCVTIKRTARGDRVLITPAGIAELDRFDPNARRRERLNGQPTPDRM